VHWQLRRQKNISNFNILLQACSRVLQNKILHRNCKTYCAITPDTSAFSFLTIHADKLQIINGNKTTCTTVWSAIRVIFWSVGKDWRSITSTTSSSSFVVHVLVVLVVAVSRSWGSNRSLVKTNSSANQGLYVIQ
jgi:hypothetical protein